tara:strand:+ start:253 stop:429 length:177 start_codon:yes stop_codon:yes gene_type:complete
MIRYRVISKEVLEKDLTYDDALTVTAVLKERGLNNNVNLEIEEYQIPIKRLGRDPDLH